MFYIRDLDGKRKKIVPSDIFSLLTRRGLAYWIMDDGSAGQSSNIKTGLHLNTYKFTSSDVLILEKRLNDKFNLKTFINKHKSGDRIYIWEESMIVLRK